MSAPIGPGRRHRRRETAATLRLHVKLEGAFPPVWRRLEVASDLGLDDLHGVLQVVFGWEDYHLYRFTTGPQDEPGAAFACTADLAEAYDDDPAMPTWDVAVDELLARGLRRHRWLPHDRRRIRPHPSRSPTGTRRCGGHVG